MSKKNLIAAALGAMTILAIGATVSTITTANLATLPATTTPQLTDQAVIVTNGTTARLATLSAIKTALGTMAQTAYSAESGHSTNADIAASVTGLLRITNSVVSGVVTNGDGSITVTTTNQVYLGLRP